jgi:uncharacterized protein
MLGREASSAPVRRPLLVWVLPDAVLALALTALLTLPILLASGQGNLLGADGQLQFTPPLFFFVIVAQNLAFAAVVLARVLLLARLSPRWLGISAPAPAALLGLGLAAGLAFLLVNLLLSWFFSAIGVIQNQAAQYPLQPGDWTGQLLIALAGTLLAPVGEELFFRGYVYGALRERFGVVASCVGSAALFAAAHLLSATQGLAALIVPVFVLGVLLAWLRERSASLLPSIIVHMLNNGVGMLWLLYCVNVPGAAVCR